MSVLFPSLDRSTSLFQSVVPSALSVEDSQDGNDPLLPRQISLSLSQPIMLDNDTRLNLIQHPIHTGAIVKRILKGARQEIGSLLQDLIRKTLSDIK